MQHILLYMSPSSVILTILFVRGIESPGKEWIPRDQREKKKSISERNSITSNINFFCFKKKLKNFKFRVLRSETSI